jgi:hypothetical protein
MATSAPPTADAAGAPPQGGGAVSSLVAALNRKQQQLVSEGKLDYPDEYSIEFVPAWLGDEKLRKPGDVNFAQTAMAPATGGLPNPSRATPNPDIFSRPFDAGQSIAFVIDRIIMESSYIYNQQSVIIDKNGKPIKQGVAAQNFAWYNILCFATPTDKWDSKRRDWAYKIKYVVVPYETPVISEVFPNGQFRGAHKNYNYWFTGQNQEVLHFEVTNNNAYYNVINTPLAGTNFKNQFNALQIVRGAPQARSPESDQGAPERVIDPAANAADWLYNAVDYADIRLRILGDPAWINAENYTSTSDVSFAPFRNDGSINFSTGPAYFTINYNLADDYNLDTGLMNIQGSAVVQNVDGTTPVGPSMSFNYMAIECRSSFRQGRFEQELVGRLRLGETTDRLIQDRTGLRPDTVSRVSTTTTTGAPTGVRPPNVGVEGGVAIPQGIQGDVVNIPNISNTVTIGNQVLPVLIPALNPANRPLLNISPRPSIPGIINPPIRGPQSTPGSPSVGTLIPVVNPSISGPQSTAEQPVTSNSGQNMQRDN